MRGLTCSALLLMAAAPIAAQRIDGVPHAAEVVEMAPATLDELARAVVTAPIGEHEERRRPIHDRTGAQLSFLSIYQFWHDPAFADTLLRA
jgi:hypothetical protein